MAVIAAPTAGCADDASLGEPEAENGFAKSAKPCHLQWV
jgi:hypothetical protein